MRREVTAISIVKKKKNNILYASISASSNFILEIFTEFKNYYYYL